MRGRSQERGTRAEDGKDSKEEGVKSKEKGRKTKDPHSFEELPPSHSYGVTRRRGKQRAEDKGPTSGFPLNWGILCLMKEKLQFCPIICILFVDTF